MKIYGLLLPVVFALVGPAAAAAAAPKPSNVLFIAIDDFRPKLGSYGDNEIISPNIDRLAGSALIFSRAYCQVPICGASRASLMTGILPTRDRFINHISQAEKDVPGAMTLPEVFKNAGYTTLSNGKIFHIKTDTQNRSWSEPAWRPSTKPSGDSTTQGEPAAKSARGLIFDSKDLPDNAYADGQIAERTIEQLRGFKQSGKPFFIASGFFKPHMPFYAPKRYWDLYDRDKISIANNRDRPIGAPKELNGSNEFRSYGFGEYEENSDDFHRMMRHGYLACVSYVDKLTGDILGELEKLGLAENTIVVIWGDHGFHLGEHSFWGKHNTMHVSIRVPLIIKVPGKGAGTTSSLVETSDIFPTLCKLAGLAAPETVQGRDFSALFDDPRMPFREFAYSRYLAADAVISNRFNFTSYNDGKTRMLYDLENDPQENVNLADDPSFSATVGEMEEFIKQRKQEAARFQK